MKLHEIVSSASSVTIKEIFDELSKIFDTDESSDDVMKMKALDLKSNVIHLHVETHALETDYMTTITLDGNTIRIKGFDEPISFEVDDNAEDTANSILGSISTAADQEDTDHRDDEEDDDYGR